MTDRKTVAEMTVEEREAVLRTLGKRLHFSSSIAKHEGDPIWRQLAQLSERLLRDADEIAGDQASAAAEVVLEAITLLGKFELDHPHDGTVH